MKQSQCDRILAWMKAGNTITQREASQRFGCDRLGARIYDLRRQGAPVTMRWEIRRNEAGEYKRYARYGLEGTEVTP